MACRSAQEFKLKAEIARGGSFTADDFVEIVEELTDNPDFAPILVEAVGGTSLFDAAFCEKDFYIDYYLAKMEGRELDNPDDFLHLRVLDAFMRVNLEAEWGAWHSLPQKTRRRLNAQLKALYAKTVEKLTNIHGDLASISNFSKMKLGIA